jgi:hypothetical protein
MRHSRHFSLDEATQALTQVTPLLERLKDLHASALPLASRLEALWRRLDAGEQVLQEIATLQKQLDAQSQDADQILRRLDEMGCVVRDAPRGLVDFPSRADGAEFYLCWQLGEEAIGHWHGLDEGFAGRKPLSTRPGHVMH